jgi:enamine deaminase RidA (YjgF/YER057c/UK114 family)
MTDRESFGPEFIVPAGYGELMRDRRHYSQAVRVGPLVLVAGQGGWDDELSLPVTVEAQLRQVFANIGRVLEAAGCSWADVVELTSYHVGLDRSMLDTTVELLREHCPGHQPVWTALGVARLARPEMLVEISVRAIALDPA